MSPGDVVRCIDDRYSEGRLVRGRLYVVRQTRAYDEFVEQRNPSVPIASYGVKLWGVENLPPYDPDCDVFWKSSRFVPVNRKDLETEIPAKVADKIMVGAK